MWTLSTIAITVDECSNDRNFVEKGKGYGTKTPVEDVMDEAFLNVSCLALRIAAADISEVPFLGCEGQEDSLFLGSPDKTQWIFSYRNWCWL